MKYFESDTVELKRELVNSVKKEIISFLNTRGGTIFIGVDDDGTVVPILDHKQRDEMDKQIGNWIQDAFYPDTSSLVKYYFNEDDVMVIEVTEGPNKPYFLKEKGPRPSGVYKRVGSSARPVTNDEILTMIMSSRNFNFESEISREQKLTFKQFFEICKENHIGYTRRQLKSFGFINKDGYYTNLAQLMSDQNPIEVKFAAYDKHVNFIVKVTYKGSLVKILEDVLEHASRYNDVSAIIDGRSFKRIETLSYPGDSLREGILNAFCHADYSIPSNIKVEFYDHKVKITNPGGIYRASLKDIFDGVQTYRNPGLVNIFNKLGYIENFGTGIPRIQEAYELSDKKPVFNPTENFFKLSLPNMNYIASDPSIILVNDPVSPYIDQTLSKLDLFLLDIIVYHPGLSLSEILQLVREYDESLTEDIIQGSLEKLNHFVSFKENEGYYLKGN